MLSNDDGRIQDVVPTADTGASSTTGASGTNGNTTASAKIVNSTPKSKIVAALLAIFLGAFGVHNFYLGYNQKAIIQCVISVVGILLGCCTLGIGLILTFGVEIWAFVEGVMLLIGKIDKDANGDPLAQ